ncbi:unnamed protein product [Caenorhabditis brenneri]
MFSIPFLNHESIPEAVDSFWIMFYFYSTVYMMGPLPLPVAIRNFTPRVQKMSHVILELFGMILSTWMALGAFIAIGFEFHITKNAYICLPLIAFSFIFCCDAWACFFTESYMLCEHRELRYQMKRLEPVDGIIYNVAVRRNYGTKNKVLSGFDFYDDEMQVDKKWLEDNDKGCYWT